MGSRSTGYNNVAYWSQHKDNETHFRRGPDAVQYYQSYNETFVDDESCFENHIQESQRARQSNYGLLSEEESSTRREFLEENSPRRRSESFVARNEQLDIAESFSVSSDPRNRRIENYSIITDPRNRLNDSYSASNDTRNRLNDSYSASNDTRNRLNDSYSASNDTRNRLNDSYSASNDKRHRLNDSYSTSNNSRNKFNDYCPSLSDPRKSRYESISTGCSLSSDLNYSFSTNNKMNESFSTINGDRNQLNESFSTNNGDRNQLNESSYLMSSPRKSNRRERSSSAPGRRATMEVFAPMIAQCQDFPTIRRSRSTVRLPKERNSDALCLSPTLQRQPRRSTSTKTISAYPQSSLRPMAANIVSVRPKRLQSFNSYNETEMVDTALLSPDLKRKVTAVRKPSSNLAVIPPNCRINKSAVPLLTNSPTKFQTEDIGSRSPTKDSWLHNPSQQRSPDSLWLAGMILLITGFSIFVLCFILLSKRKTQQNNIFLDLGAISGFVSFILGFLGFRKNSWNWLLNRNYVSGYIILILLNLLQCGVVSLFSSGWNKTGSPEEDITSGAIGGLAVLTLLLSILGLGASTCCKNPPPDNRVAHCAQGFII